MKLIVPLLTLLSLVSCVSNKIIATDGYFESADTINCVNELPEEVFVWSNSEPLPFDYEEVGVIELSSHEANGQILEQTKAQESLLNLALLMAWDNCANGLIEVETSYNRFSAIAVRTSAPTLTKNSLGHLYKTGFVEFVENEQQQNEFARIENAQSSEEWIGMSFSIAALVIGMILSN